MPAKKNILPRSVIAEYRKRINAVGGVGNLAQHLGWFSAQDQLYKWLNNKRNFSKQRVREVELFIKMLEREAERKTCKRENH